MKIIIEVKTGSRQECVQALEEGKYLVKVKEERHKGKANKAVLRLLKKHFDKQARVVFGASSTTKIVEISE